LTQYDHCWTDVYTVRLLDRCCKRFAFRSRFDQFQPVAKPLDGRASYENASFQSVLNLPIDSPRQRCQKAVFRFHTFFARIHQHETASAECVFSHAFFKTRLSKQSSLLISSDPSNGDFMAEEMIINSCSIDIRCLAHLWKYQFWHIKNIEQFIVPLQIINIVH